MLTAIILVFLLGYLAIVFEHQIHINKAASAIVTGVICWSIYAIGHDQLAPKAEFERWARMQSVSQGAGELAVANVHGPHEGTPEIGHLPAKLAFIVEHQLPRGFDEIAGILFFLLGAMTIVELIDAHEGFALVTRIVSARNKRSLLWIVGWVTFFLSSVLDNLTTAIVVVSLLKKLVADRETRWMYVGVAVIAANAGGAWTVIGDVTTTMLWVKNKIGAMQVMRDLFLASFVCLLVPLLIVSHWMKGDLPPVSLNDQNENEDKTIEPWHKVLFLTLGLLGLMFVPVFKSYTHLPPYMGMMMSLGVLWLISELVSHTMDEKTRSSTGVLSALRRVDMSSILFFLGILLAVGALLSITPRSVTTPFTLVAVSQRLTVVVCGLPMVEPSGFVRVDVS